MGVITEISTQKNKKRVNIFVDGEFVSGLSFETAAKYRLNTGKVIDEKELLAIIFESELQSAFSAGLDCIAQTSKSGYEVKQKLIKKGFKPEVIDSAIEKLKSYGYIDDKAYAVTFVKLNSRRSKRELEQKLKLKGISHEAIIDALGGISGDEEYQNALVYAEKYVKNKQWTDKVRQNLYAGLIRKGFSFDTASRVIEEIKGKE